MTKTIKTALLLCLSLCVATFVLVFAACSNNNDSQNDGTYTVTILYEGGTPVSDVDVQLCVQNEDGTLGLCLTPVSTNASGVATIEVDYESLDISEDAIFHIQINRLPGYTADVEGVNPITLGFDSGVSTTLGNNNYTITVVDRTPQE